MARLRREARTEEERRTVLETELAGERERSSALSEQLQLMSISASLQEELERTRRGLWARLRRRG